MPESPVIEPPTPTVADNETCYRCGYDLNFLSRDGACPECGFPIEASRGARGLARAGLMWLRDARRGTICLVSASAVFPLLVPARWMLTQATLAQMTSGFLQFAVDFVFLLACIIAAAGCWWLMKQPPHTRSALRDRGLKGLAVLIILLAALVPVQDQCLSFGLWTPLTALSFEASFGVGIWLVAALVLIPAMTAHVIAVRAAGASQKDFAGAARAVMWMASAFSAIIVVLNIAWWVYYFIPAASAPRGVASAPIGVVELAMCFVYLHWLLCFAFWIGVLWEYLSRVRRAIADMRDRGKDRGASSTITDGA